MKAVQTQFELGRIAPAKRNIAKDEYIAKSLSENSTGETRLMESICERVNMNTAWKQVVQNGGAPGVDGMKTKALAGYLRRCGTAIKTALLNATDKR